jgi:predicted metal-binding transcription factor (methanogenesis marker protein 9)
MLGDKDKSLVSLAEAHFPLEDVEQSPKSSKKRKSATISNGSGSSNKKEEPRVEKKREGDLTLGDREEQAMEALFEFVEQKGGSRESVSNFTCRVTRKSSDGRYDTNYYNEQSKRFRSMVEVCRYLNLVTEPRPVAATKKVLGFNKRKATSREIDNEKKRLRKELEKLRKLHSRATKTLDDFVSEDKEAMYPVEDLVLQEEDEKTNNNHKVIRTPRNCASARMPDIVGFPTVPQHCIPDLLMVWDFMCTFTRAVAVHPIGLDDFVQALTYQPPKELAETDAFSTPPVYIAEAHLGLLKLLLFDPSSDEWWWSILETDETENMVDPGDAVGKDEAILPLIRIDMAALLAEAEDPLITTSWIQNLEEVRKPHHARPDAVRDAVRTAIAVVANKWVRAYLRKSLELFKTSGAGSMKRAVVWLLDRVLDARPDLFDRSVNKSALFKQRAKVVEEVSQQMEKLSKVALAVNDEDLASDVESDDESEDESDDDDVKPDVEQNFDNESEDRPASVLPPKPLPTLVDLLLPPAKPSVDLLNSNSWPHIAGAAVCRILHRYKRLRNEVDDSLRNFRELPRLSVKERRQRESFSASRVFSESCAAVGGEDPCETAVEHLCAGGHYLHLTTHQRLCVLRILIEAAYDTATVYQVVDSNYKQRINSAKALDVEQRRAKKAAKEKSSADEAAARADLAFRARRKFIEEKREEIRSANEGSNEFTNEEIDALPEEEIIEFDEDIKADYEALPTAESFKKTEVVERVAKMQEAAAFETEMVRVMTMEELLKREEEELATMKTQLDSLGGDGALIDPTVHRDTSRTIERLRREIEKIQTSAKLLQQQREQAVDVLRDATADGTIKSLRNAIRISKTAKLFGFDGQTNGVWTLDAVRDAHIELFDAKQLKRVADAQKELISKLNKCFIRTEPIGRDRFRNRFWRFDMSEHGHIWVETDYLVDETPNDTPAPAGFVDLKSSVEVISIGAADIEEDFGPMNENDYMEEFRKFSRTEYHGSGSTSCLVKRHWGCHVTDSSLRSIIKTLDSRGTREKELKENLKETLEDKATTQEQPNEANDTVKAEISEIDALEADVEAEYKVQDKGDGPAFLEALEAMRSQPSGQILFSAVENLASAIGARVRVRVLIETTKDGQVARYEVGSITAWKIQKDVEKIAPDEFDSQTEVVLTPLWRASTDTGREFWLSAIEVMESITRYARWSGKDKSYFENDAAFLAYRNSLGRHCGRAADAPFASTPIRFSQLLIKREGELYTKLKHKFYDNNWGGKNGSRNAWLASMKDFAFDFETVREGLLTLEAAFHELTGGFPGKNGENTNGDAVHRSGKELLDDPTVRNDIELESLEKSILGLWNSKASRAIFLEIVKSTYSYEYHQTILYAISFLTLYWFACSPRSV